MSTYTHPVSQLLPLGNTAGDIDYASLGLQTEHVPELIRMLRDRELLGADGESAEVYAPGHAAHALGQLHALAAVDALLEVLEYELEQGRDWILDEFPEVLAQLGPGVFDRLSAFLQDPTRSVSGRGVVCDALDQIGLEHPDFRGAVVDFFCRQLSPADGDPVYNGYVLAALLDLKAVEALPVIETAFAARRIDPTIAGGWKYAQWELEGRQGPKPDPYPRKHSLAQARSTFAGNPRERAAVRRKAAKKKRKQLRKR